MKLFNSVGHYIATVVKAIVKDAPKVIAVAEQDKPVIEAVSAGVATATGLPAPAIVGFEDLGFALLGEVGDIFINGTAAQQQHFQEAGLDLKILDAIKIAFLGEKALVAGAKAIAGK